MLGGVNKGPDPKQNVDSIHERLPNEMEVPEEYTEISENEHTTLPFPHVTIATGSFISNQSEAVNKLKGLFVPKDNTKNIAATATKSVVDEGLGTPSRPSTPEPKMSNPPSPTLSRTSSTSGADEPPQKPIPKATPKEIQAFKESIKKLDQQFQEEIERHEKTPNPDHPDAVKNFKELRTNLKALENPEGMNKLQLETAKQAFKEVKSRFTALKVESLEKGVFYQINEGKAKEVYKKAGEDATAYFTPVKNNPAKQKEIEEEVAIAASLRNKFKEGGGEHIATNLEVVTKDAQILGRYTVKTDAASGDAEKLIRSRSLKFPDSLQLSLQFAKSTRDFHKLDPQTGRGHIHGDIKPENALIYKTKEGLLLKASDFGKTTEIGPDQTKVHTGNQGFAPPEGGISMQGEVYSTHIVLVRLLENEFLGDVGDMLLHQNQVPTTVKEMDGYEKYLVDNKFTTQTNSLLGRVSSYATMTMGRSRSKMSTQFDESSAYIQNLITRMNQAYPENGVAFGRLQTLLLQMADSVPSERPTAEEVVRQLESILNSIH